LSRNQLLIINGAALTGCAVFAYAFFDLNGRSNLLIGLMLFLPLLDKTWSVSRPLVTKSKLISWVIISSAALVLIAFNKEYSVTALTILMLTALPEEWFFRAYFMQQLEKSIANKKPSFLLLTPAQISNLFTSIFFALLHTPTQGWFALAVFIPSMIYGWIFQKSKDIVLVILLHALSNIIFIIYIKSYFEL